MFNGQCLMVNGQWIGWGLSPKPLVSDRLVASTTAIATAAISAASGITASAWLGVLVVLHVAAIGTGHTLHLLAVAVKTGNLHGRLRQLLLQIGVGGKDNAPRPPSPRSWRASRIAWYPVLAAQPSVPQWPMP